MRSWFFRYKTSIMGCIFAVALWMPGSMTPAHAQDAQPAPIPSLFLPSVGIQAIPMPAKDPTIVRTRTARINLNALEALDPIRRDKMALNLFDDVNLVAVMEGLEARSDRMVSYHGSIEGEGLSDFQFVVNNGVLVGVVRRPGKGLYRIEGRPGGTVAIRALDDSKIPECGGGIVPETAAFSTQSPPDNQELFLIEPSIDDGYYAEVLVLYTDVAKNAAGGTDAIRAEAQLAIDAANRAYSNSGINIRVTLAGVEEVSYNEDGSFNDHLNKLTDKSDGVMDHIHGLRDTYAADMVSLLVEDSESGGLAWVMTGKLRFDMESRAFSIVNRGLAAGNWTLVHELGHNMGCSHNRENADTAGCWSFSYGYRWTGKSGSWRSVMAYNNSTGSFTRVGQFSNPDVNYDGSATGIAVGSTNEAHNVKTINDNAFIITRWRASEYWVQFGYNGLIENGHYTTPYDTLEEGVNAVPTGGTLKIKGGSTNTTIRINKAMTIRAHQGDVVIGR